MKSRLSSWYQRITGDESCTICAIVITVLAVVAVWQLIQFMQGQVSDKIALHDFSAWRR